MEQLKPGVLSKEDKAFIRKHAKIMSIEEIAKKLGRRKNPIKRFVRENYLVSVDMSDDEQEQAFILEKLHGKPLWNECTKQFTKDELRYFEQLWIDMMKQLSGDVLSSEELQLKKFITYEILRDRCMVKQAKSINDLDAAEKDLELELSRPRDQRNPALIGTLRETINSIRSSQSVYVREFYELSDKQEKIANALRTSRDNRVRRVEDAKTNFTSLLKLLDDEQERERLGKEIYLYDQARQKKKSKMEEYHTFFDNEIDRILITSETIDAEQND